MPRNESTKYLLIGGGAAVAAGAVGIREVDSDGRAIIVAAEPRLPYDRPPLSKGFLNYKPADPADIESKDPSFYAEKDVEVRTGIPVDSLDRQARTALLADGTEISYEKVLIATGATPKMLPIEGMNLPTVCFLRTVDDAERIRVLAKHAKRAVLIGAGYIGMEVAASLRELGLNVTVVELSSTPWSRTASPITGNFLRGFFEKEGVEFLMDETVDEIGTTLNGDVVRTSGNRALAADLVVVGVGVTLNSELAGEAGLKRDSAGAIVVNSSLHVEGDVSIWAAGDVAAFPDPIRGHVGHLEHYMNAKWTGRHAGRGMAGDVTPYDRVPYFFSDMFDLSMVLRGDRTGTHPGRVVGDLDTAEFVELYEDASGRLGCAIGMTRDAKRYDKINDALEAAVRDARLVHGLGAADVGLD